MIAFQDTEETGDVQLMLSYKSIAKISKLIFFMFVRYFIKLKISAKLEILFR